MASRFRRQLDDPELHRQISQFFPGSRSRGNRAAIRAEERRKRQLRGLTRGGTLLTGPQGVLGEPASIRRQTLLGG